MFQWRRSSVSFLLILSTIWFPGCRSSHAQAAPSQPSSAKLETRMPPLAKRALHDSAFSTYNNPNYGVSFRYPRNYFLNDAFESAHASILEARQQLAAQQPGATLVAIVTIPPDAYPNTTFVGGTLQLIVNPAYTPEICRASFAPNNLDPQNFAGTSTISGVLFDWLQSGELAQHRGYTTRVYSAFFHSACYEFQLEVTSEPSMVPGFDPKPADSVKIMHQLDKIVSSVEIHNPQTSSHPL
jgi:hypothetical protein